MELSDIGMLPSIPGKCVDMMGSYCKMFIGHRLFKTIQSFSILTHLISFVF